LCTIGRHVHHCCAPWEAMLHLGYTMGGYATPRVYLRERGTTLRRSFSPPLGTWVTLRRGLSYLPKVIPVSLLVRSSPLLFPFHCWSKYSLCRVSSWFKAGFLSRRLFPFHCWLMYNSPYFSPFYTFSRSFSGLHGDYMGFHDGNIKGITGN